MMTPKQKERFIKAARMGYGDDVIYDQAGIMQIVFRLKGFTVYVNGKNVRVENE